MHFSLDPLFYTLDWHVLVGNALTQTTLVYQEINSTCRLPGFAPAVRFLFPVFVFTSHSRLKQSHAFGLLEAQIRKACDEAMNGEMPSKLFTPLMSKLQISQVLLCEVWKMKRHRLEP